ncbi:L-threonine 3-dehydrogenase [Candidatus Micrarchaeota archaeon]|nr:L-threonine 3-dehydrogenase [Candidatus Micrarchaeota archaeon]
MKMLSVWKTKPEEGLEVKETEVPKITPDEVLVKVKATSICGTDMHIYGWDDWAQKRIGKNIPYIFGHEMSGEVVELGKNTKGLEIGDHVSAETHISCGYCFQCKTGNEHICENVKILGVDRNGTYAQYVALPYRNAWINDKKIPHWVATAQEPLGNAVHTVFDGEIVGKTVTVFGMGPIGVCAVALCKLAGAEKVIAIDRHPGRLKYAKDFGADVTINGSEEKMDIQKEIMNSTEGRGADVFLEMAGAPSAMTDGLATLRAGGRASILGVFSKPFEIDVTNQIVFKGIRMSGINGRKMFDTWYKTRAILASGKIKLDKLVSHKFKLKDIEKGFQTLKRKEGMKIVLEP